MRNYAQLKKASKARKSVRRQWGTTLPQATSKKLKKVNLEAQARRRALYRKKLAAYRKSECYKIVEARAGGRCEATATIVWEMLGMPPQHEIVRCEVSRRNDQRLTHHHVTYRRFGGKELPEDIIVLCDRHNAEAESQHPTRRRFLGSQGETRK